MELNKTSFSTFDIKKIYWLPNVKIYWLPNHTQTLTDYVLYVCCTEVFSYFHLDLPIQKPDNKQKGMSKIKLALIIVGSTLVVLSIILGIWLARKYCR